MVTSGWAIDGPVETEVAAARRLAATATGGAEGVGSPNDLKVVPLAVPGQGVQILPGSALIRSRYTAGESYQGALVEAIQLPTTPTGSSPEAGRSDMVVMRVEDPWAENSSWPEPADPIATDYFPIRIIQGVPSNARRVADIPGHQNDSAVALARIDFPKSTGTVGLPMIHDLRKVAMPQARRDLRTHALVADETQRLTVATAYPLGGQTWPVGSIDPTPPWAEFEIPEFATHARVRCWWTGVKVVNNCWGDVWVEIAPLANPDKVFTQSVAWNSPANNWESRIQIAVFDDVAIPQGLRGTTQRVFPRGRRHNGVSGSYIELDWASAISLEIEWYEAAA